MLKTGKEEKSSINLGGDVDSLASIVVGILAGKYGISDLPLYMIENVEGVAYLKEIANHFSLYAVAENKYVLS